MDATERRYGLPRGLIRAVAIRESGEGKHLSGDYNAWGIGPGISYNSWPESIEAAGNLLAHWIERRGNVRDALCTWVSGKTCSEAGEWYANEVISLMDSSANQP
jgi:hypothetical protein